MGASSRRTLHSPGCWLPSHLHTLLCGLGLVSILSLFLAILSRKGGGWGGEISLNLCSFLKSLRKRKLWSKQAVGRATALLPAEGSRQPERCLCLSSSPCPGTTIIKSAWPGAGEVCGSSKCPQLANLLFQVFSRPGSKWDTQVPSSGRKARQDLHCRGLLALPTAHTAAD